jgi:hypothetical protein
MSTETEAPHLPDQAERDASARTEAIIAAVLTLAAVGTRGAQDAVHVVGEYRKILLQLSATADPFR